MRRRPPRFTLVLSALVAAAALAIVIAGQGAGRQPTTQPPTIGIGSAHACIATRAEAQVTDRSSIVVTAKVESPVSVTEQASGPRGIATVTRSDVVSATVRAVEPVEVKRTVTAKARRCAHGESSIAAGATALRAAYARALAAAHALAADQAAQALKTLIHSRYPTVLAGARDRAGAKSRRVALVAEASLAAKAEAEARRRAGD